MSGTLEIAGAAREVETDGVDRTDGTDRRAIGAPALPPGALGVVLAGDAETRLVVLFDRYEGRIAVLREGRLAGGAGAREVIAEPRVALPDSFAFAVRWRPDGEGGAGVLEVRIDDERALSSPVPGRDARGDWGVLAEPGGAGVWRGLAAGAGRSRR